MKFPSIGFLFHSAKASFFRFPLSILASILASAIGIFLIEEQYELEDAFPLVNTMLCLALAIPLYFCVSIVVARVSLNRKWQILFYLIVTLALIGLYFTFPSAYDTHNTLQPYFRYAVYNIIGHLLVAYVPYNFSEQLNGFWNYNKLLFIRILEAQLYAVVLYIGLIVALVSLNTLFDIEIHNELFAEIAIVIFGVFNTWFFVAGIPSDFNTLNQDISYPNGLRIFAQYVLLPLLGLYLLILYGYGSKIILLWDWPKGIVSYLILCFSVLGVFTLLLLYPYGKSVLHSWIKKTSRVYYFLLLPLLGLLAFALLIRIGDYGITINRYLIAVLGLWLSFIGIYFLTGRENIKIIPQSLSLVLLMISFGPWSMFSISESSQVSRLESILSKAKILVDGKINAQPNWVFNQTDSIYTISSINDSLLSDSLHNEVKSIFEYLDDYHGFASIRTWYSFDVDVLLKSRNKEKSRWSQMSESSMYIQSAGLKDDYRYQDNTYFSYYSLDANVVDVSGYDYLVDFQFYNQDTIDKQSYSAEKISFEIVYHSKPKAKFIIKDNASQELIFKTDSLISCLIKRYGTSTKEQINSNEMSQIIANSKYNAKILFNEINFQTDTIAPSGIRGKLFLKKK